MVPPLYRSRSAQVCGGLYGVFSAAEPFDVIDDDLAMVRPQCLIFVQIMDDHISKRARLLCICAFLLGVFFQCQDLLSLSMTRQFSFMFARECEI